MSGQQETSVTVDMSPMVEDKCHHIIIHRPLVCVARRRTIALRLRVQPGPFDIARQHVVLITGTRRPLLANALAVRLVLLGFSVVPLLEKTNTALMVTTDDILLIQHGRHCDKTSLLSERVRFGWRHTTLDLGVGHALARLLITAACVCLHDAQVLPRHNSLQCAHRNDKELSGAHRPPPLQQ